MPFNDFQDNPLSGDKRYSRDRKILFGYDQAARLTSLNAAGFAAEITATTTTCNALETAMGRTGSAIGTGRGSTQGTNTALDHVRQVVGSKYRVLQDRVGKDSEVVTTVFGHSIQRFTAELTKTNAAARLEELDLLLEANVANVGADIVEAIADAVEAYTGKRTVQRQKLADVGTSHVAEQGAETALDQQLWLNACRVVIAYPDATAEATAKRHAAANYSLLVRPAHTGPQKESGPVAPGAVVNLFAPNGADVLLPTTPLTLHNTGAGALRFGLAPTPTGLSETDVKTLEPGEKLALPAADLGDVAAAPYLNVGNPTDVAGAYEVLIG